MTITLDLNMNQIACTGTYEGDFGKRDFTSFKVNYTSGKRVYLTVIRNGMNLTTIPKLMSFEDGNVFIKMGKEKINIGSYQAA